MSFIGIVGRPGSGKTYSTLARLATTPGRHLYFSIELDEDSVRSIWQQLERHPRATLQVDARSEVGADEIATTLDRQNFDEPFSSVTVDYIQLMKCKGEGLGNELTKLKALLPKALPVFLLSQQDWHTGRPVWLNDTEAFDDVAFLTDPMDTQEE